MRPRSLVLPVRYNYPSGFHVKTPPDRGYPFGAAGGTHEADPTGDNSPQTPWFWPDFTPTPEGTSSSSSGASSDSECALEKLWDCPSSAQYDFTLSGMTNAIGTCCPTLNRTWTLSYKTGYSIPVWYENIANTASPDCTVPSSRWVVSLWPVFIAGEPQNSAFCGGSLYFSRTSNPTAIGGGVVKAYYLPQSQPFDCDGSTVFTQGTGSTCAGWPSTITVSRV